MAQNGVLKEVSKGQVHEALARMVFLCSVRCKILG